MGNCGGKYGGRKVPECTGTAVGTNVVRSLATRGNENYAPVAKGGTSATAFGGESFVRSGAAWGNGKIRASGAVPGLFRLVPHSSA